MSKVKHLIAKMLLRRSSSGRGRSSSHSSSTLSSNNNNYGHYESLEEIAQNQANERMLLAAELATQQVLLCCLETADGSFYWHAQ